MINWVICNDYIQSYGTRHVVHEVMCPVCKFKQTFLNKEQAPEWCYICGQPRAYKEA